MTGRTLEEIEALAAEATPGPWEILKSGHVGATNTVQEITFGGKYGGAWIQSAEQCGDEGTTGKEIIANAALIAALPDLLAIAQGQREEIARLRRFEEIVIESEKALAELVKNHKMPGPTFENCDPGFFKQG